jgi:hypothetical protein
MRLQQSGERRSEPGESLAPDRSRRQAGGLAAERGRHPVAVELAEAVEPGVELAAEPPIALGREAGRADGGAANFTFRPSPAFKP